MPRKEFGKRCLSYNGAIHWNNLPYQAKIAESLSSFKTLIIKTKNELKLALVHTFRVFFKSLYFLFIKFSSNVVLLLSFFIFPYLL